MSTKNTKSIARTETFTCLRCGLTVSAYQPNGERRDHCPSCIYSQHTVDRVSGGVSECLARMIPISIAVPRSADWLVIHRCTGCDVLTSSPMSADDNQLILVRLAVRPLAQPPFPLEVFGDL
ncbi:RNHCP domain-containing protein [Tamaricihabitans halophyticus]|uniref:RNHCP domain-containing protein n=1 Tax=Tamaricihabitans halophyticus TaxID=1262583 RepID=A0A4R2QYA8_9PSEU|nr:RNHCP domain-containing protein [Tamaricihabitans halophyticus]TCP55212.1 RNHCP domain-containing protein [Tamaricihabitans halophyticus]